MLQNDKPLVEDLFLDLRDGEILLSLLEILTAQQYVSTAALHIHNQMSSRLHLSIKSFIALFERCTRCYRTYIQNLQVPCLEYNPMEVDSGFAFYIIMFTFSLICVN